MRRRSRVCAAPPSTVGWANHVWATGNAGITRNFSTECRRWMSGATARIATMGVPHSIRPCLSDRSTGPRSCLIYGRSCAAHEELWECHRPRSRGDLLSGCQKNTSCHGVTCRACLSGACLIVARGRNALSLGALVTIYADVAKQMGQSDSGASVYENLAETGIS